MSFLRCSVCMYACAKHIGRYLVARGGRFWSFLSHKGNMLHQLGLHLAWRSRPFMGPEKNENFTQFWNINAFDDFLKQFLTVWITSVWITLGFQHYAGNGFKFRGCIAFSSRFSSPPSGETTHRVRTDFRGGRMVWTSSITMPRLMGPGLRTPLGGSEKVLCFHMQFVQIASTTNIGTSVTHTAILRFLPSRGDKLHVAPDTDWG